MNTIVQICYGAKLNLHNGSKFWRKKLIWFQNFYYIKKAAIVSNFCLIGKILHDFSIPTSIELARKTFIGIQVKVSIECNGYSNSLVKVPNLTNNLSIFFKLEQQNHGVCTVLDKSSKNTVVATASVCSKVGPGTPSLEPPSFPFCLPP